MYLEELSVLNFRNLKNEKFKFKNNITVFFGNNGQGKTNLIEAIYLLSTGKSFRSRIDRELISWGEEQAKITGKADNLDIELTIKQASKELSINKQTRRLTELIGSFIVVVFTPSDIEIVSAGPDKKRRFLDRLACVLDKQYLFQLVSFNKILKSRNQILFNIKSGKKEDLWIWDKQLSEAASYLWLVRTSLVGDLNNVLKVISKKITKTNLRIVYELDFRSEKRKEIEEDFLKKLELSRNFDIRRSLTSLGPHRDEFKIITEGEKEDKIISKDLGIYGSRGEQKAATLALKLAEIQIIETKKEAKPVLILDEVLGELDQEHQELLLYQLKKQQTFITTTSTEGVEKMLGKTFEKYLVEEGRASKV